MTAAKVMGLRGRAPLTLVRTTDQRMVYVYRGRPAPANVTDAERDRLLKGKFLEEYELPAAVVAALKALDPSDPAPNPLTPGEFDVATLGTAPGPATLEWVGTDKARATQALDAEQAKPLDGANKQRVTLISSLQKIVDAEG